MFSVCVCFQEEALALEKSVFQDIYLFYFKYFWKSFIKSISFANLSQFEVSQAATTYKVNSHLIHLSLTVTSVPDCSAQSQYLLNHQNYFHL